MACQPKLALDCMRATMACQPKLALDRKRATWLAKPKLALDRKRATWLAKPKLALDRKRAKDGGEGQNRTVDTTIFSRMLYQLSYLATPGRRAARA
jgi:hypothetical protein